MVGARGFEPPTLRSRTVRATKLRYAPIAYFTAVYSGTEREMLAQFVPPIKGL